MVPKPGSQQPDVRVLVGSEYEQEEGNPVGVLLNFEYTSPEELPEFKPMSEEYGESKPVRKRILLTLVRST